MKPNTIFFLFLLILILSCTNKRKGNYYYEEEKAGRKIQTICDEQTAKIIGKLHYISNPLFIINNWAELNAFVNENRSILLPGSKVIQCMREVGLRMQGGAMQAFDPQAGNRAYSRALDMGATAGVANQIKSNIEQNQIQFYVMGQDLVWLSQALPKGSQGDWSDFNKGTVIRNQAIEYIKTMVAMFQYMGEAELLNYVMSTMPSYQPYAEYQTAIMVSWFSN